MTISTGLSNFLKMVIAILKQTFPISSPKKLRDNKSFYRLTIKGELEEKLNQEINECKHFEQMFLEALNMHAPIKRELLRANHVSYMTKALRKAISQLQNIC